jgi:hypothetical protein
MSGEALVKYMISEIRCAKLRAQLAAEDLDAIGLALANGLISPIQAICHIEQADAFRFLGELPPELEREVGHA